MTIKNIVIGATCVGAICLFSAFGGEKVTLQDQMKKIDEVVAENVASFTAKKREECAAMVTQKATGLAEAEIAKIPMPKGTKKAIVAPIKKAVVPVKKAVTPVKPAPTPAPVVKPAPAPAPTTGRRGAEAPAPAEQNSAPATGRRGGK